MAHERRKQILTQSPTPVTEIAFHKLQVNCIVSFEQDSNWYIISGADDCQVVVWTSNGEHVGLKPSRKDSVAHQTLGSFSFTQ